jgi:hypothetical protein
VDYAQILVTKRPGLTYYRPEEWCRPESPSAVFPQLLKRITAESCIFVLITHTNYHYEATLGSVTVSQPYADSICLSLHTNKREFE